MDYAADDAAVTVLRRGGTHRRIEQLARLDDATYVSRDGYGDWSSVRAFSLDSEVPLETIDVVERPRRVTCIAVNRALPRTRSVLLGLDDGTALDAAMLSLRPTRFYSPLGRDVVANRRNATTLHVKTIDHLSEHVFVVNGAFERGTTLLERVFVSAAIYDARMACAVARFNANHRWNSNFATRPFDALAARYAHWQIATVTNLRDDNTRGLYVWDARMLRQHAIVRGVFGDVPMLDAARQTRVNDVWIDEIAFSGDADELAVHVRRPDGSSLVYRCDATSSLYDVKNFATRGIRAPLFVCSRTLCYVPSRDARALVYETHDGGEASRRGNYRFVVSHASTSGRDVTMRRAVRLNVDRRQHVETTAVCAFGRERILVGAANGAVALVSVRDDDDDDDDDDESTLSGVCMSDLY